MSKKNAGMRSWLHQPKQLIEGHVVYQVKLLGNVSVSEPKGADLVKEAIRKVKFNLQVQKSEGTKPRKVEVTVSTKALGLQEKQNKISLYSFPLQHISYCADDKADKKICAFIARNDLSQTHECFVLESEKSQAEDITLTVGQAFDIAFQKYKENVHKDPAATMKKMKQYQDKIKSLQTENDDLRARVIELEEKLGIAPTVEQKERTSSTSSNTSQPFVFQLESFGGTSSTDTTNREEFINNIFGPPLDTLGTVNGTASNSNQQNGEGESHSAVTFEETFEAPQTQVNTEASLLDISAAPVLAPPPRPVRQKRRQAPPSLLEMNIPNNNEVKTAEPSVYSTNPFQDQGDWTQPAQPSSGLGDLLFDTQQQPTATKPISFDDLDPLAS